MRNAEKVLLAIKIECDKQTRFAEVHSFEKIADKAMVPRYKLELYLEELKECGYIDYSPADNFIHLTRKGKEFIA